MLKDYKVYLLNAKKQEKLDEFLKKHLKSERIRSSKSPYVTLFFSVKKWIPLTSTGLSITS